MGSTSFLQRTQEIFEKHSQGEISFQECWLQQGELLDQCKIVLLKQLDEWDAVEASLNYKYVDDQKDPADIKVKAFQPVEKTNDAYDEADDNKEVKTAAEEVSNKTVKGKATVNRHKCPKCPLTSERLNNIKVHVERTHLKLRFYCTLCDKSFSKRSDCNMHIKSKVKEDPKDFTIVDCRACSLRLEGAEYSEHVKNNHSDVLEILNSNSTKKVIPKGKKTKRMKLKSKRWK